MYFENITDSMESRRKEQLRQDWDEQDRHNSYPFFDCVTKVTVNQNTNNDLLKLFNNIDMSAALYFVTIGSDD